MTGKRYQVEFKMAAIKQVIEVEPLGTQAYQEKESTDAELCKIKPELKRLTEEREIVNYTQLLYNSIQQQGNNNNLSLMQFEKTSADSSSLYKCPYTLNKQRYFYALK